jgi:ubiquinone biosynthesis protein
VLLDAGFMAELNDDTRRRFAEFFLAVALGDGRTAARIVRETAHGLPSRLDVGAFDADVSALVRQSAGRRTSEFSVASFVGRLFAIQRRHGLTGTSRFTLAILSMFVFEGVAKARAPRLDFQREAVPFLLAALA